MITVNVATGAVKLKVRAPIPVGVWPVAYATMSVWDSVNWRVIFPFLNDPCGCIQKMLVYDPASDTWEDSPVPPNIHDATLG
jgi:hypothetical protein